MDFSDPIKTKKVFVVFLVLTIVFFLGAGTLGYLYYQKANAYKTLEAEKNQLAVQTQGSQSDFEKLKKRE